MEVLRAILQKFVEFIKWDFRVYGEIGVISDAVRIVTLDYKRNKAYKYFCQRGRSKFYGLKSNQKKNSPI